MSQHTPSTQFSVEHWALEAQDCPFAWPATHLPEPQTNPWAQFELSVHAVRHALDAQEYGEQFVTDSPEHCPWPSQLPFPTNTLPTQDVVGPQVVDVPG